MASEEILTGLVEEQFIIRISRHFCPASWPNVSLLKQFFL